MNDNGRLTNDVCVFDYKGTHPEIPEDPYGSFYIYATVDGVDIDRWRLRWRKRDRRVKVRHFDWSEIVDFDYGYHYRSHEETHQRYTATRVALFGIFALAIPKTKTRKVTDESFYWARLSTTTGVF